MKTINELENELRGWAPCPPSPGLRTRIFGRPKAEPGWSWSHTGLALASVAGLALVIAVQRNSPALPNVARTDPLMLAVALSNENLAACFSCRDGQEWNLLPAGFECTNLGDSMGSPSLQRGGKTNR